MINNRALVRLFKSIKLGETDLSEMTRLDLSELDGKISHYGDISRPITSGGQSGPSHGARQQHQLFLKIQLTLINSRRMG